MQIFEFYLGREDYNFQGVSLGIRILDKYR